jgi:cell division protein FtsQ
MTQLGHRVPKGLGASLTIALFAGAAAFGLARGGHLDAFTSTYGDPRSVLARMAGFDIRSVTISGLSMLDEQSVLKAAAFGADESLPFLDVDALRLRLLDVPMVRDVAVRKFYPNALSIGIVENKPYALWQLNGDLSVVGVDGRVIGPMNDAAFADLPLVVGEGAAAHVGEFVALLDAQPEIKTIVRAGIRVGDRRWTLKLFNGLDVHLPEENPAQAVARFASMVRDQKILDKDLVLIDLRQSDRVILRLTEAGATARADLLKARAKAKGGPA